MSATSSDDPVHCHVTCATCHELLWVEARKVARKIVCPECGRSVRVPARDEIEARKPVSVASNRKDVGEYSLGEVAPVPVEMQQPSQFILARTDFRQEAAPPPPKFTFFNGVFLFPWQGAALPRWINLSLLLAAALLVAMVVLTVGMNLGLLAAAPQGGMLAFFVLPEIWLGTWSLSYAAACCLAILETTAAGGKEVDHWPQPQWKEWAFDLIFVVWILIVSLCAAFFLTLPVRIRVAETWPLLQCWFGVTALLFPIFMLSAMEVQQNWLPFSAVTWASLFQKPVAWLVYYLTAGLLWAACGGLFVLLVRPAPIVAGLVTSPLLAANLFIQARLLGRLAWKIAR